MKKYFVISILLLSSMYKADAQSRGIKIGYIDMEYILQNVPDYTEAKNQLEQKAQKWKQDIETKKIAIAKLNDALKTERALLTKELIEEREEEIKFQETELLDFQQKKFGPDGDLMTQKAVLVKPIQDQVFTAVQDIAEVKKYDFVFDKASDLTMLFAAKRFNISDQVIRVITRAERRQQLSKKELKAQEKKEYQEDVADENPALSERKKALEEKKAAREKLIADRKLAAEEKKKAQEEKRQQLLEAKTGKKTGATSSDSTYTGPPKEDKAAARAKLVEDRKKAQEEKRQQALDARANKKTGTIPANNIPAENLETKTDDKKVSDTISKTNTKDIKAAARAKLLEDKKKALEDKKKKITADREAVKKAKEDLKKQKDSIKIK